jgi:hypothetical protein
MVLVSLPSSFHLSQVFLKSFSQFLKGLYDIPWSGSGKVLQRPHSVFFLLAASLLALARLLSSDPPLLTLCFQLSLATDLAE